MILSTTPCIEGRSIHGYHGIVTGDALARMETDDADAVVGVVLHHATFSDDRMLVTASGTAVKLG